MKKIILAMLFSVFLLSAMIVPALSQDEWEVGVSVGEWYYYEGEVTEFTPTDPSVTLPDNLGYLISWNITESIKRTVTDVTGTVITFETETVYTNGTTATTTSEEDVATSYFYLAIWADMEAGDEWRPASFVGAQIINETIDTEYDGLTRETNVLDFVFDFSAFWGYIHHMIFHWDKATGIQVKRIDDVLYLGEGGNITIVQVTDLMASSVWVVPEFPTGTVMLLAFVAITISINLYIRKKLKH